jgi:invasion protein IalB
MVKQVQSMPLKYCRQAAWPPILRGCLHRWLPVLAINCVLALAPLTVMAQERNASATPAAEAVDVQQGWRVICQSTGADRSQLQCNVLMEVFRPNGQRLTSIEVLPAKAARRFFVTAPLGTSLASKVQIKLDAAPPRSLDFQLCQPAGCIASVTLTEPEWTTLLKARTVSVSYEFGGQKIDVPVSMAGFAAAARRAE